MREKYRQDVTKGIGIVQKEGQPLGGSFPWENRTSEEWKTTVRKEEATRLFYLASKTDPQAWDFTKGYRWIDEFHLGTLLKSYWHNNIDALEADVTTLSAGEKPSDLRYAPTELVADLTILFEEPTLFSYLQTGRQLLRERNKQSQRKQKSLNGKFIGESEALVVQIGNALQLDEIQAQELHERYNRLVELFLPRTLQIAIWQGRLNRWEDREERDAQAALNLSLSAFHFYWETVLIDPEWTARRFLSTVTPYDRHARSNVFDTRTLETATTDTIEHTFSALGSTEGIVLARAAEAEVIALITTHASSPVVRQMLAMYIFDGQTIDEISTTLGKKRYLVERVIAQFREQLKEQGYGSNTENQRLRGGKTAPFWDNLFGNVEKYKEYFEQRKSMLRPFHRKVVEAFFACQTGERDSTIDAVWHAMTDAGFTITRDTVRRAINGGINQLDYKEKPGGAIHGQLNRGWGLHQEMLLVAQVAEDPNIWQTFSQRKQYILRRYFIDGNGEEVSHTQIAQELGIHGSTVGREIDRALREIRRMQGNPNYNPKLLHKPRHNLPK